tara:strand:+ start:69 stop:593 length:525 start_codon:yes stop_codon:yes gene_type:complete
MSINYLKDGNPIQQQAFKAITDLSLCETLNEFTPLLAGTIPININIENSDLDVVCYWKDKSAFIQTLDSFSHLADYHLIKKISRGRETVICRFSFKGFLFEIFGQNRPSHEQEAFRHMIIEYQILENEGESFRKKIIELKESGFKTELAFAKLLGLEGDPYEALLNYKLSLLTD